MAISTSNCGLHDFFDQPVLSTHKKYEALRSFFYEKKSAEEVAKKLVAFTRGDLKNYGPL